jgi:hypothetical protein
VAADLARSEGLEPPNLLIRSYWRAPAPFNGCSSAYVPMLAHGSSSARGLLYPTAVRDDRRQRACVASSSRSQLPVEIGRTAPGLPCGAPSANVCCRPSLIVAIGWSGMVVRPYAAGKNIVNCD